MSIPCFSRIKKDTDYRIKTFLLLSLVSNLIYSLFLLIISKLFFSKWFFTMSLYYGLLSTTRIIMLVQVNATNDMRLRISTMRLSGIFLLILNIIVSIMMFLLIRTTRPVKHHEITVITLATYTFTSLTLAIINTIKHFKNDDFLYFSIKVVGLISASVSIVTLTNTMLATFGDGDTILRSILLPILSAIVSIFIVFCAILMIVKSNKKLRLIKNEQ